MIPCNTGLTFELWNIFKKLNYRQRYLIYYQWNQEYIKVSNVHLKYKAKTISDTRKVLRRLTTENFKSISRQLIHVAHTNPLVVFSTILNQIV